MQLTRFPAPAEWPALCRRPAADFTQLRPAVAAIFAEVAARGDGALIDYTARFDGFAAAEVVVWDETAIATAAVLAAPALRPALETAARNIRAFHAAAPADVDYALSPQPGVRCWSRRVPLGRVGLYVPGGSAPLFSTLLMLAIPAQLAGCEEIVVCTPPGAGGALAPVIAVAAQVLGLTKIIGLGGAQAIAALALGTATVPRADKICGPGNAWVTAAKQLAQAEFGTAIDLPAGPSEVLILADGTANPAWVAADLLAQAEHGPDSQVVLVTDNEQVLAQTLAAVEAQLAALPRREIAAQAIGHSRAVLVRHLAEGLAFAEEYAPEHLLLALDDPAPLAARVRRAGSVFLGHFAPESCGDYASGPNHTLPTAGAARAYSGVSVETFTRRITFQELTPAGLRDLGPTVVTLAEAEGLQAHAEAVRIRLPAASSAADSAVAARAAVAFRNDSGKEGSRG